MIVPHAGTRRKSFGGTFDIGAALDVMRRWHAAGAFVMASEAVPLADELGAGWWAVDIGSAKQGQARTGANRGCVSEWVTMNRAPAWRPAVQGGLFG